MDKEAIIFECVRPIEEHAHIVMDWRNDPETLAMSFHQEPKKRETFFHEFCSSYFSVPDLPPLFIHSNGKRVAFLRFRHAEHPSDHNRRCCEISINVSPKARGEGIGQESLKAVQSWVKSQGYDAIYAEVKNENTASHHIFKKAGFVKIDEIIKVVDEVKVPITRYLLELTDTAMQKQVFIIAEAGSNWRVGTPIRDMAMAMTLIDIAADAGADAVKFQTFRPETVYVENAGQSDYLAAAGLKEDIRHIFADLAMPYEMVSKLADYCKKQNIQFMSSAFSEDDFATVDPCVLVHKIASYEISHVRLIELTARSGKPLILSTGAAGEEDIAWAVQKFTSEGGHGLTLLQCTAKYPASLDSMNLRVIPWLKQRFGVAAGLSDHSRDPVLAPVAAVALGASVIEKHFTLSNDLPGPDHVFAVTPPELKQMVDAIRNTEKMLGTGFKKILDEEGELRAFAHRGVQALHKIKKGEIFAEGKNIGILRPGKQSQGVHPRFLMEIEGKTAKREIAAGSGIMIGDW
ncbi:MAG: GNAT family N-acetyltransferase [Chlamydiales bacterium]|nr:GNAT family N-acetyltransferase [Chlamydiia bacterium]MCP5507177.1 GNAT family N-acetyltransferase [Chlamydiales bacterium]